MRVDDCLQNICLVVVELKYARKVHSSTLHDFGEEIFSLLGYYATYSSNSLRTFFGRQVVPKRQ
jgi:hypothetical protein